MKVHILEGSRSDGRLIYACGRTAQRGMLVRYIGRAKKDQYCEVTCRTCQRTYHICACIDVMAGQPGRSIDNRECMLHGPRSKRRSPQATPVEGAKEK